MRLRNPVSGRGLIGVVALGVVGGGMFVSAGQVGLAVAAAVAAVWLVFPPVFPFVVGQIGLAAVAAVPLSDTVAATQLALIAVLFSDDAISTPWRSWTPALVLGTIATPLVAVAWTYAPLVGAVTSLIAVGALAYGTHRYQLLATNQLTPR